jgi:outer membrane lipoprotein-sorting protein
MRLSHSILSVVCLGLLWNGCAPTASRHALSVDDMNIRTLLSTIARHQNTFRSMEADGSVAVETPTFSNSGSFELHIKKPDSLLVKIEGPFGIDIANLMLTQEKFLVYNSLQNKIIRGTTSKQAIESLLNIDIDFSDILNLFGGVVSLDRESNLPMDYSVDNNQYMLAFHSSNEVSRYWIDPDMFSITRIQVQDQQGNPVREVAFSDFRSQNTTWLPYHMKVSDYRGRKSITLIYTDARVNIQNVTFPFAFPENAEQIDWQ